MVTYQAYAMRGGVGVVARDSLGTHSFGLAPRQALGLALRLVVAVLRAWTVARR